MEAQALATLVFAGSAQLAVVTLSDAGAAPVAIVLAALGRDLATSSTATRLVPASDGGLVCRGRSSPYP